MYSRRKVVTCTHEERLLHVLTKKGCYMYIQEERFLHVYPRRKVVTRKPKKEGCYMYTIRKVVTCTHEERL